MSYTFVQEPVLKYLGGGGRESFMSSCTRGVHECLSASNSTGNDYKYMLI